MLSQQLKQAIRRSGVSISQLARDTDIPRPTIHRFLSADADQHRDIRLEATADRLAEYLNLVLAPSEFRKKPRRSL
jgi:hypothetical protein